jgi:hypothetical protein
MRIDEGGHQRLAAEVDHLRVRPLMRIHDAVAWPYGDDETTAYRQRLGGGIVVVDRDNIAARVDDVSIVRITISPGEVDTGPPGRKQSA